MRPVAFIAALASALGAPALALAIELSSPLDCEFGVDCIIQNYVDAEPGPGVRDFECGALAYDHHEGTDFRLPDRKSLATGYAALATAPGTVLHAIDDQPDHGFTEAQADPFGCGNAVVIDHGAGWTSQYCHLAQDSLTVREGQRVERGAQLGLVGSSGGTDFPHLHYALRRYGAVVNPFTGVSPTGCEAAEAGSLWRPETGISYIATAALGLGVTGVFPSVDAVENDLAALTPPSGLDDPVYVWVKLLGARRGDSLRLMTFSPDGRPFASEVFPVRAHETVLLVNIGVTPEDLDAERFPPGRYRARIAYYSNGERSFAEDIEFTLQPHGTDATRGASREHIGIGGKG